jgi:hypothetical protein
METINTGLKEIAIAKNAGNSAQDALKWLVDNHEKWLLFFDNADDPTINLNTFLPKCNHGNIVVTSRNPGLCVYAGSHSLVIDMEEADAVPLLLKSAALEISPKNEKIAAEIVKVSHRSFMSTRLEPMFPRNCAAFLLPSSKLELSYHNLVPWTVIWISICKTGLNCSMQNQLRLMMTMAGLCIQHGK